MKQIAKIGFLILLISQVYCQVTPSLCPNLKTQDSCNQNQSCQWTQTNEFSCSSPFPCISLNESDCYAIQSNCSWNTPIQAQCAISGKYCQFQDNQCNDTQNCSQNQAQAATCTVKGAGFGCQRINDQTTCGQQQECNWVTGFCANNDNNYCENLVQNDCQQAVGCQWSQQGSIGTCGIFSNNCSKQTDQTTCTGFMACQWNTYSVCLDNPNYCDPTNCDQNFCNYTSAVEINCSPNITKNACLNLNQDNCKANEICTYVQQIPGSCTNINQCSNYGFQNQCNSQQFCSWSNVYQCQAKGNSGGSTYSTKLISGILVLLLICFAY
ncbi:hypothetical protein ABPG72_014808 [Tetrahymena utriculariae]